MSQRINISIPDALYERLTQFKDSIKISQVCQTAILAEIERKETFIKRLKEPPVLEDVIDRLKQERTELIEAYVDFGRKDGLEWAKISSFVDLNTIVNHSKSDNINHDQFFWDYLYEKYGVVDDPTTGCENAIKAFKKQYPELGVSDNYAYIFADSYLKGFHESVLEL